MSEQIRIGKVKVRTVLTKSNLPIAGYSVNPYIGCTHACKYCYACFMKRFTGHAEPWGTFLDVKYWDAIRNPQKYDGQTMIVGSVTDAYNPQEEQFCRTRAFLEEMQGSKINLIITTKSDLVLRDLDLIKNFPSPLVSWSVNTLDEKFKDDMDRAVSVGRRIAAMKKFHKAGIRTTCFISPIFPQITNVFAIIEKIKDFCDYIWLENLNLRGNFKAEIMDYIANKYADLMPLYREIYNKNDDTYWKILDREVAEYAAENGFLYVVDKEPFLRNPTGKPIIINYFYHSKIKQSAKKKEALQGVKAGNGGEEEKT